MRAGRSWPRALAAGLVLAAFGAGAADSGRPDTGSGVAGFMSGPAADYAMALRPRAFEFPRDHGAHPEYRSEWWYLSGHLTVAGRPRFGFQLTFFRFALAPAMPARESNWATRQVYMAHFALSDFEGGRFRASERFARGALGLAGARVSPFRVWLGPWRMSGAGGNPFPLDVAAAGDGASLALRIGEGKPLVLQGDAGLSRKGRGEGNASYYYSYTRLPLKGEVRVGGKAYPVAGRAWMDREWGSSALAPDQVGWDWFALQLSDGRELMYYRIRRRDGSADPHSRGILVAAGGETSALAFGAVELEELDHWISPGTGVRYPARWRLSVPAHGLRLVVAPRLPDQELDLAFRYWEGAASVRGSARGETLEGDAFVELVGYGKP